MNDSQLTQKGPTGEPIQTTKQEQPEWQPQSQVQEQLHSRVAYPSTGGGTDSGNPLG